MDHQDFKNIVKQVWKRSLRGDTITIIWTRLKQLKVELKDINKLMAAYTQKLNQVRQRLEVIQANISHDLFNQDSFDQEKTTLLEIPKWSLVEKIVLRQKSRAC